MANASVGTINLGATAVRVTPIGIGTWSWGDSIVWKYGSGYAEQEIEDAFQTALRSGVTFFDSAEMYGRGKSEKFLGQFVRASGAPVTVATKFMPLPWRLTKNSLLDALRRSLDRLGMERVDLYQIHWPLHLAGMRRWMEGLAEAVDRKLALAVGVSNYSAAQMRRAYEELKKRGVPLASNQVEYSLVHRAPERNGVLDACRDLNVKLIAYSPIGMGMLSGKYSLSNRPPGYRGRRYGRAFLERLGPLLVVLKETGEKHGGKTSAQVAINWTMARGAVPIPGAKTGAQARELVGAVGWSLSENDSSRLDEASRLVQR